MRNARKFSGQKESVSEARRFARDTLSAYPGEVRDQIELMVSELATNCVRHANSDFEIQIETAKGIVRIEVHDRGPGEPIAQSPGPTDPTGRGLRIVDAMSDSWGVVSRGGGKIVWFELQCLDPSADEALGNPQRARHGSPLKPSPERSRQRTNMEGARRSIFEIHLAVEGNGVMRPPVEVCKRLESPPFTRRS